MPDQTRSGLSAPAPLCPVKFMAMRSEAHFTGVGPEDRTGVGLRQEERFALLGQL